VAHVGDEFGFYLARELGFNASGMFRNAGSVTQNRVAEKRRVFSHQRTGLRVSDGSEKHLAQPNAVLVTDFNLWASA
jgi:hypothetical protein